MNFPNTKKIGIYIAKPLNCNRIYMEKALPFGLKAIISEINLSKYSISFCNRKNVDEFDFLLFSVNSHYDYLILIRDFFQQKVNPTIIVGGSDIINLHLLRKVVDVQVIGRAEGQINDILEFNSKPNVWYRADDPYLRKKYEVRQVQKLLKVGTRQELDAGCPNQCFFCQYGNKFQKFNAGNSYNSGTSTLETMFSDITWGYAKNRLISSIDGTTEKTRKKIGKQLTDKAIIEKIKEADKIKSGSALMLKLYCIIGFPWETEETAKLTEIQSILQTADASIAEQELYIDFRFNHFVPMLLTPFEHLPVNLINYRQLLSLHINTHLYFGQNISSSIYTSISHSVTAAEKTYVYRSFEVDEQIFKMTKNKYFRIPANERLVFFQNCDKIKKNDNLPSRVYS